jgi:hypothetical protein
LQQRGVVEDQVAEDLQGQGRVVEDLAEDERLLGLAGGVGFAWRFVGLERLAEGVVVAEAGGENLCQVGPGCEGRW